ncbi:MAG: twin-arginine translocase subunit TatC [Alphaproteobacteria bacterium]
MTKEQLKEFPLIEHLTELRSRIIHSLLFFIFAFVFCYTFKDDIYNLITYPLISTLQNNHITSKLIYTKITEAFTSTLSITFSSALFISIPYFAIELWLFITPALYKNEKRYFFPYLLLTPILFLCGVIFCYFLVLPQTFDFLISFANSEGMATPLILQAKITEYIDLTITLLNAFGLCFLLPIFLILLIKFNILERQTLIKARKYAIILIFIISAILTPPDVISQILLAIPLMLMYELSIILTKQRKIKPTTKKISTKKDKKKTTKSLFQKLKFFKKK